MALPFQRPFGEGQGPSESQAERAGGSFVQLADNLLLNHPGETDVTINGQLSASKLVLGLEGAKAHIDSRMNMGTGDSQVTISLYEPGEVETAWGPKISQYSRNRNGPVRRMDYPGAEARTISEEMIPHGTNTEELSTALRGLRLEMQMGLNVQPVGTEEIQELGALLETGNPMMYHSPPASPLQQRPR